MSIVPQQGVADVMPGFRESSMLVTDLFRFHTEFCNLRTINAVC